MFSLLPLPSYCPSKIVVLPRETTNSIQTLDRRTTGATLFQMERRPFIRSGLVQAETAYTRTNTNVSRSEMPAGPMGEHHQTQIRTAKRNASLALIRAARQYAKQYTWQTKKTHSTPTQSIAERPVTSSGRLQVSQEANIGELSELSTGSSSQLSPTCWVPHTDTEPIPSKETRERPPGYCGQLVQHRKPAHETAPQHARSVKVSGSDLTPG